MNSRHLQQSTRRQLSQRLNCFFFFRFNTVLLNQLKNLLSRPPSVSQQLGDASERLLPARCAQARRDPGDALLSARPVAGIGRGVQDCGSPAALVTEDNNLSPLRPAAAARRPLSPWLARPHSLPRRAAQPGSPPSATGSSSRLHAVG